MTNDNSALFVTEMRRRLTDAGVAPEAIDAAVLAWQQTDLAVNGAPIGSWMHNTTTGARAWRTLNPEGTPVWQVFNQDGSSHTDMESVLQPAEQWAAEGSQ